MASYDPNYANVVMLLLGNGTNDSQTIVDEKSNTITVNGNTCIKTAIKKFGTGSIYFDGTGDYLSVPITNFQTTGGQDFTIDGWVYPTAFASDSPIMRMGDVNFAGQFTIRINSSGILNFTLIYPASNTFTISSSIPLGLNQWQYFAVSRVSGVFRMYINSNKVAQGSQSGDITSGSALRIGGNGTLSYQGYIDDLRFTKYGLYSGDNIVLPAFEAGTTNVPPAITITSITPDQVPLTGGTPVTVVGSGFSNYTTCTIDSTSITGVTIVDDTQLTGYTPAKTSGSKDVVVGNP